MINKSTVSKGIASLFLRGSNDEQPSAFSSKMEIEVVELVSEKELDKWGPINVEQVTPSLHSLVDLIVR